MLRKEDSLKKKLKESANKKKLKRARKAKLNKRSLLLPKRPRKNHHQKVQIKIKMRSHQLRRRSLPTMMVQKTKPSSNMKLN